MGCKASVETKKVGELPIQGKKNGDVGLYGVYASMNCMGAMMLVTQEKCGDTCFGVRGEGTKENTFHGVPKIKDGDLSLSDSDTILRYLGGKYAPDLYINLETQRRSFVDWAIDRFSSSLYPDAVNTIYVVAGFSTAPDDQGAAGQAATENLAKFAEVFLKEQFIGGKTLSIADYKVAPFFFAYAHPKVKEICSVEIPERIKRFNFDFRQACEGGAAFLSDAGGESIKEVLDEKSGNKDGMITATEGFKEEVTVMSQVQEGLQDLLSNFAVGGKNEVKVYGVPASLNCVGPIVFGQHVQVGTMEACLPGEQSQTEEHKKINPFGGVPAMKDGAWSMGESCAILRHIARSYALEYYPKDPKRRAQIDFAMDRFSFGMYNDCVATIYVAMGYAEAPTNEVEKLKAAGQKASEGLKEFADLFLAEKFIGGEVLSVADFKVAPFFAAYAHKTLKDQCYVEVPERIVKFNSDFAEACPAAELFRKAPDGMSILEVLDSRSAKTETEPTQATKDLQAAMAAEAQKVIVVPEEQGPKVEEKPPPFCAFCAA